MDLQIESRNVPMTARWKKEIQQRMDALHKLCGDLSHGRVTLIKNGHHKKQGNVAEATIVLGLPGRRTIVAKKDAPTFHEAIKAGFDAVAIKVHRHLDKRSRTEIRTPPTPPLRGVICKLYPSKGYGFILKEGGGEVYFHKNALHELAFSELEDGLTVAFDIEPGKKGPHATTVNPLPTPAA